VNNLGEEQDLIINVNVLFFNDPELTRARRLFNDSIELADVGADVARV